MQKKKYAMVIDLKKCLGCKTCTVACNTENSVLTTKTWNPVLDTIEGDYPNYKRTFLPRPCMHCEKPPCVDVCPTGASHEKHEWGIVLIDQKKCIGCRCCITACPYEARVFNWKKPQKMLTENPVVPRRRIGVVEKCTFCVHKITEAHQKGLQVGTTNKERDNQKVVSPACVSECIGNARYFGDLNDPGSEVSQLLKKNKHKQLAKEAGTKPNVYYIE
jgi:molybdopterin-containing oxidoreductase family iron-sulfur binding subunit